MMNTLRWKRLWCRLFGHGEIVSHITYNWKYSHDSCYRCGAVVRINNWRDYLQWCWEDAYKNYPEFKDHRLI